MPYRRGTGATIGGLGTITGTYQCFLELKWELDLKACVVGTRDQIPSVN
jgi:hypothetical protein